MAQHPSVMDNLWRRPVRVYAGVAAVVTAMIIMAYHAHAAWHVAWVFPVALVAGMALVA